MPKTGRFAVKGKIVTRDGELFLGALTDDAARADAITLNKGFISPRAYADGEAELIEREIRG